MDWEVCSAYIIGLKVVPRYFFFQLYNVTIKARQLRGTLAVGLLTSARDLRQHLTKLLFLAEQNAETLFPHRVIRPEKTWDGYCDAWSRRLSHKSGSQDALPDIDYLGRRSPTIEEFPSIMNDLSECLGTFLNYLNEYPEPETVELSSLLAALAKDLEVHTLSILFFPQLTLLV